MECQLPITLNFDVNTESNLPTIKEMSLHEAYDALGAILGVTDYHTNLASFWLLDIVTGALQRAQSEFMVAQSYQRVLISWFGFTFEHVRGNFLSREEVFRELERKALTAGSNLLAAKAKMTTNDKTAVSPSQTVTAGRRRRWQLQGAAQEIISILEILYDIFANPFAFTLVRTAFGTPPEVVRVEYPYTIHVPKKLKRPIPANNTTPTRGFRRTPVAQEDTRTGSNRSPSLRRGSCVDLPAASTDNDNEYILPLKEAVTQKFFDRIFSSGKFLNESESRNSSNEQSSISNSDSTLKRGTVSVSDFRRRESKAGNKLEEFKFGRNSSGSKTDIPQANGRLQLDTKPVSNVHRELNDDRSTAVKRKSLSQGNIYGLTRQLKNLNNDIFKNNMGQK